MNPQIEIGGVVGDGYRIDAFEASTPAANLYRGTELRHRAPVTVSVLHAHLAEDDGWWAEIKGVAAARAKVEHSNLVPLRRLIDRPRALVFDRFKGRGLEQIFKVERGIRPAESATTTLLPVADALEQAHRVGLLHGKLTPTSIVVQQFGSTEVPMLVDLGLDTNLVRRVAGAAAYRNWQMFAAPERLRGEEPDARSDIYALAAILYCLCTGYVPVIDPDPPSKIVADVPWEWEQALLRALEKKPGKRHSSFGEFCDALADSLPEINESNEFVSGSRTGPRTPTAMFASVGSSGGSGSASREKRASNRRTRDEVAIRAEAEHNAEQRQQREARAIERVPTGGLFPEADYHQRSERERRPSKPPRLLSERRRSKPARKMPTSSNKKTTRPGVKRPVLRLSVTADDYHSYFGAKATDFFCPTNDPPNLGARITVAVTVAGSEAIQIVGKVISRRLPSKDNRIPGGVGLTITAADRYRVEAALRAAGDDRDRR